MMGLLLLLLLLCGALQPVKGATQTSGLVNVAFQGIATQSTTFNFNGFAANAINGLGQCSCTAYELSPWWRVDLRQSYQVASVAVTNHTNCCPDTLNGAEIRIGNSLENNSLVNPRCALMMGVTAGRTQSYTCGGMVGRYVTVVIPGRMKYLTLGAVEVFSVPALNQRQVVKVTAQSPHKGDVLQCQGNQAELMKQLHRHLDQNFVPRPLYNLTLGSHRRKEGTDTGAFDDIPALSLTPGTPGTS